MAHDKLKAYNNAMGNHKQNSWYLYLIRTQQGALYTGITTDIKRRFSEHDAQGPKCAKSLRGKGPLTLVFKKKIGPKSDALKLECQIKSLPKSDKEFLVKNKKLPTLIFPSPSPS